MFDIGMQELIVIFIVALLVIGPKKLPELGRTLGKGLAELRRSMQEVKNKVDEEVRDLKDPLKLDTKLDVPKWDEGKSPYQQTEVPRKDGDKDSGGETAGAAKAANEGGAAEKTSDKDAVKG